MKRVQTIALFALLLVLAGCTAPADVPSEPTTKGEEGVIGEVKEEPGAGGTPTDTQEDPVITVKKSTLDEIQEDIDSKEEYIKALSDELLYYKEYARDFALKMSSDKLEELINKEWTYKFTVNGVNFPKDGVMELSTDKATLVLSEERTLYSVLTEEQSISGRAGGFSEASLTVEDHVQTNVEQLGDRGMVITYDLKDLVAGDELQIKLDENVASKLGLDSVELSLHIKK